MNECKEVLGGSTRKVQAVKKQRMVECHSKKEGEGERRAGSGMYITERKKGGGRIRTDTLKKMYREGVCRERFGSGVVRQRWRR